LNIKILIENKFSIASQMYPLLLLAGNRNKKKMILI